MVAGLPELLAATHAVWASAEERRRLRAFGFRPAVEPGVLKREWRGMAVRVAASGLLLVRPNGGELRLHAPGDAPPALLLDGAPLGPGDAEAPLVAAALDLVGAYERWVEAREGRRERIERSVRPAGLEHRRPLNALAETRRLQRLLQPPRRSGRG